MSYETDCMIALKNALRDTEGLKIALKEFNKNAKTLERLAEAIEKQNELKERELALLERQEGMSRTFKPRNY
ncbi:hypothetical protein L3K73_02610 [Holdemanella sp. SCCA2]|nr:hypothetical protein [Holdemanella sp. SCCA2]